MVALADVRRWDPAAVEEVFTALGGARVRLRALDDRMAAARTPPDAWQGAAADAARAVHDTIATRLDDLHTGLDAARLSVADAADGVVDLRARLADLDARAVATGFALGAEAAVTDVRQTVVAADQADAYRAERATAQTELVDSVRLLLARADDLDATLLAAVTRATAAYADPVASGPTGSAPDPTGAAGTVPAGLGGRLGATLDPAPGPTDNRTPVPALDPPGRGYTPAPGSGPLVTVPAPVGPGVLITPPPPDLGLDRNRSSDAGGATDSEPPPYEAPQEITGRTAHGDEQIQGRDGHGVNDDAVDDAVANPTEQPTYETDRYDGVYEYVGRNATVHLNRDGQVVTAWATNSSGWRHS